MASRWILAFLVVLLAVAPSAAQQPLPLDPGKAWKHKHSGIIVPATLAGTPRDRGMTYAPDELPNRLPSIFSAIPTARCQCGFPRHSGESNIAAISGTPLLPLRRWRSFRRVRKTNRD